MTSLPIHTLTINWPAIFAQDSFRVGWRQARAGLPHDYAHDLNKNHLYTLGRLIATEAAACELPDLVPYFSMQMRTVAQQAPAAIKDMCEASLREKIDEVIFKANEKGELPKTFQLHINTGLGVLVQTAVFESGEKR